MATLSDAVAARETELPVTVELFVGEVNETVGTVVSTTLTVGERPIVDVAVELSLVEEVVNVLVSGTEGATAPLVPPRDPYVKVIVWPLVKEIALTYIVRPENDGMIVEPEPIAKSSTYTVAPFIEERLAIWKP